MGPALSVAGPALSAAGPALLPALLLGGPMLLPAGRVAVLVRLLSPAAAAVGRAQ
ncbi:MAG TPA: hypothetical protein VGP04_07775 [Pseudonocardiaceae bacterium]|nr:hypothetical protein [Pseudonocardiaceae bacterium]